MTDDPARAAEWDLACRDYAAGIGNAQAICDRLGVSVGRFYAELRRRKIVLRRSAAAAYHGGRPDRQAVAAGSVVDGATGPGRIPGITLSRRIEALLESRIARIEAAYRDHDPERTDRRLAQLTRTLAQIRGLHAEADGHPEDGREASPAASDRSLAELRDDLLGHLDRLRAGGRAADLGRLAVGGGDLADAGPLAAALPAGSAAAERDRAP